MGHRFEQLTKTLFINRIHWNMEAPQEYIYFSYDKEYSDA